MTDQERKVMEMALDALNELTEEFRGYDLPYGSKAYNKATDAINSLHQALAQGEQTPVAVWELTEDGWETIADAEWMETLPFGTKLYTAPPSKQELVFDITAAVDAAMVEMKNMHPPMRRSECERLIKAALYTAPPSNPEQEPVAWWSTLFNVTYLPPENCNVWESDAYKAGQLQPLYTAPPKREWVSLTDEEVWEAYEKGMYEDMWFARAIEAKLKELNHV